MAALAAAAIAGAAGADVYTLVFSGTTIDGSYVFDSTAPTVANGTSFIFYQGPSQFVGFFGPDLGGLSVQAGDSFNSDAFYGPNLIEQGAPSPVFSTGPFTITSTNDGLPGTVTISRVPSPAAPGPEVGAGLLSALAAGLALVLTRRRRWAGVPA